MTVHVWTGPERDSAPTMLAMVVNTRALDCNAVLTRMDSMIAYVTEIDSILLESAVDRLCSWCHARTAASARVPSSLLRGPFTIRRHRLTLTQTTWLAACIRCGCMRCV
eukprot:Rmarinus@m.974